MIFIIFKTLLVLFIFYLIILFISTIDLEFKKIEIDDKLFINNFNIPIDDIKISINTCPKDYEPLISDYWGGFADGCVCETKVLTMDKCDFNQKGCRYSSGVEAKAFDIWKGRLICVLRKKEYFGIALVRNPFSNCDFGYKNCGIIDSFNNILCQPKDIPCPYNYIEFVNIEIYNKKRNEEDIKVFNITDNLFLVANNASNFTTKRRIINNFHLRFNKPCAFINNSYKIYDIEKGYFNLTCEKELREDIYQKVDENNYLAIMRDNNYSNNYLLIPSFKESILNYNMTLYRVDYMGMYLYCLKDKNLFNGNVHYEYNNYISNNLINFKNKYYKIESFSKGNFLKSSLYILIIFLCFIYISKNFRFTKFPFLRDRKFVATVLLMFVAYFLFVILFLVNFYFHSIELNQFNDFYGFKENLWKCSNDYLNEYFFNIIDLMNFYTTYLYYFIMFLLYVFVIFCVEICFWLKSIRDDEIYGLNNISSNVISNRPIYGELQEIR